MRSEDALLQILATHVSNVTSLIEDAHVFFMVRLKNETANPRRFWFARGSLKKDFLLHGLKASSANDSEIRDEAFIGWTEVDTRQCRDALSQKDASDKITGDDGENVCSDFDGSRGGDEDNQVEDEDEEEDDVDDDEEDDDRCPVRKGAGGPTMNRIAKDDDEDERSGDEMVGIHCGGSSVVEEEIDDCDVAFNMLVQGEDEVASAFDGMRSVKPVEEDDHNDVDHRGCQQSDDVVRVVDGCLVTSIDSSQSLDAAFPSCVGFEREEEIRDVESFGELLTYSSQLDCTLLTSTETQRS